MKVALVSLTDPIVRKEDGSKMTPEELIVYIARVSNPGNQMNTETSDKLIRYLIGHKHVSPFEQADMGVEIITSRAIAQQIIRHWSLSVQEFSQRYAEVTDMEPVQIRRQADKNRQSSSEEFDPMLKFRDQITGEPFETHAGSAVYHHIESSQILYKALLEAGVAKESARMILPLTTQTKMYLKGNIRDWMHYLGERTKDHTQLEHRQIAVEIQKIFIENFPMISKALEW